MYFYHLGERGAKLCPFPRLEVLEDVKAGKTFRCDYF